MRFFFLDGSALAKRYVAEPGTPSLDLLFDQVAADRLVVLNVGITEVLSIFSRRKNAGNALRSHVRAGALFIWGASSFTPRISAKWNLPTASSSRR